jgi:predicted PurR-regulated permease PerM
LNNASQIITNFGDRFTTWSKEIREHLPPNLQSELDTIIKDAGNGFTNSITGFVGGGGSVFSRITSSFGLILGFAAMPLFVFYILKDFEHIQGNIYSALPPVVAGHTRNIVNIIDRVLGQYLRAQVVLGIIVAVATYFVLSLLKVPYALPLAFFNGLFAIIPSIGPIIGGIIIMLVVLSEAAAKAIPVLILIIVWGVIFVVPVVATLVEVFNYVRAVSRNELTGEQSRILKAGGRTEFLRAKKR